jgi:acetyltransferase-like isoleucine patch superfamily enzyme
MTIPSLDILLYICNRVVARIPSHLLRLSFYRQVMGFSIGKGSFIFMDAWFDTPRGFYLGDHSVINQRCRLDNRGGLKIGCNVSISAEVCILTADHDVNSDDFRGRIRGCVIEDFVFIGTRALILPGVKVGRAAVIAAGAVVTRDVAPFTVVAGSPATPIGQRSSSLSYSLQYGRLFH